MSPILLDSIVAIVILLSVIFAFFRGFVREMLTIVNLGGASAAAYFFSPMLKAPFAEWLGAKPDVPQGAMDKAPEAAKIFGVFPPEIMAWFLSYAAVFFGVFLILTLAGLYISGAIKAMGLGGLDKTMGVVFGAVRGALLVFLVYLPFGYFMVPSQYPEWAKNSIAVTYLQQAYEWGNDYMQGKEEAAKDEPEPEPDSLAGKLKALADDMAKKKKAAAAQEEESRGLAPEETTEQLP